jgi:hypothetical protein
MFGLTMSSPDLMKAFMSKHALGEETNFTTGLIVVFVFVFVFLFLFAVFVSVLFLVLVLLSYPKQALELVYIWQATLRWWSCIGLPLSISFHTQQALEVAQNLLKKVRSDEVRVVTLSCLVSGLCVAFPVASLCLCRVVSCLSVILSCQVFFCRV